MVFNKNEELTPRVIPQIQGKNKSDYFSLLTEQGLLNGYSRESYATKRKIYKSFSYFNDEIDKYIAEEQKMIRQKAKNPFCFLY